MIVAHSAPWGWKSCASDGPPQVAIRITVAAGKMRAGEPEDGLDLRGGLALREQAPGDQRSTMLQSGCGKRSRICHRCIQLW